MARAPRPWPVTPGHHGPLGRRGPGSRGDVLAQLRGDAGRRAPVDPGLAGGLREWLEDGLAAAANDLPAGAPAVVVGPRALRMAAGEVAGEAADRGNGPTGLSVALARRALVGAVFALLVTTGHLGDPLAEATEALVTDRRGAAVVEFVASLDPPARAALEAEVREHAAALGAGWPTIPAAWLPRTGDPIAVPLVAGRIVLAAGIDLVLGSPCAGRASVCLVTLATGGAHRSQRADRHYLGLLETLRSGAPPARLATVHSRSCEVDAEDVVDPLLAAAVQRTIEGGVELCRRAAVSGPR